MSNSTIYLYTAPALRSSLERHIIGALPPSLLFVPFLSILYVVKLYKKERSAAVKDGLQTKQIKTCQISDLSLGRLYPQIRPQKLISRIPRSLPLCWSRFTRKMKSKIGKILQNNMEITPWLEQQTHLQLHECDVTLWLFLIGCRWKIVHSDW